MGCKRKDIAEEAQIRECSKQFINKLEDFIDELEEDVNNIKDLLNITKPDELDQLSDAHAAAVDFFRYLY